MRYEFEGRCPLCPNHRAMSKPTKSIICEGKSFVFPFWIYRCDRHGYWFYKSREGKHILLDLSKHQRLVKVEPLPVGVPSETLDDLQIIRPVLEVL